MKVVLFCGGLGMRLREYSQAVPKPMIPVGYRPIMWHVMKYYAHFGHNEFILCLGHQGHVIKEYFLNYNEALSNDFVLTSGGEDMKLLSSDIHNWKITFVDTGLQACVGERLMAVREHIGDDEMFLANYTDGVSNIDLDAMIQLAKDKNAVACFAGVEPNGSFHVVNVEDDGTVANVVPLAAAGLRINGGFFVLRKEIFDYMRPGEELVEAPFYRLIEAGRLVSYKHRGFWACMDTFKEKQVLDDFYASGQAPWMIWAKNHGQENGYRIG